MSEKMKILLLEKKNLLIKRLEKIEKSKIRDKPLPADFQEQAQELENNEVVDALDNLELAELQQINQALVRLEEGSYGKCIDCGENISKSRLKAIPFTHQCIDCVRD